MADDISLSVNLADFETKLLDLPRNIAKDLLLPALKAAGTVFQGAIINLAPIRTDDGSPGSDALPPGALKADIQVDVMVNAAAGYGTVAVGPGWLTGHVAMWVEFGHALIRGGKRGRVGKGMWGNVGGEVIGHVPPHPFMRPAFDSSAERALDAFCHVLSDGLDKAGD